jgi:hypothetical protein
MGFARSLIIAIATLAVPLSASPAPSPNDWKIALGWNQTVLPSLGTSVGAFTPPASAVKQNLASTELVSTLGVRGCAYLSVFLTSYLSRDLVVCSSAQIWIGKGNAGALILT